MKAMALERLDRSGASDNPLTLRDIAQPRPLRGEILIRVMACGVCHTELDEIAGRTPPPRLPVVPGHQVAGVVVECGPDAAQHRPGDRVGVAWIFSACGQCAFCTSARENLCPGFRGTGRDADGGYAEFMTVPEAFATPLPSSLSDAQVAPLLCAGAVGSRALRLCSLVDGRPLGLTGFGASAHIVIQLALHLYPHSDVFVFARNPAEREFAISLGASWAGDIDERPPVPLAAIIDTTPAWRPVLESLRHLDAGGRLVINAIRKEDRDRQDLATLSYADQLWMEREVKSVANVTRADVAAVLRLAAEIPLHPQVREYPLEAANEALAGIRNARIRGARVLRIG